jgi:hypothetical protein
MSRKLGIDSFEADVRRLKVYFMDPPEHQGIGAPHPALTIDATLEDVLDIVAATQVLSADAALAEGDLLIADSNPNLTLLNIGAQYAHLESNGTTAAWQANLSMADDAWIGLGAAAGRLTFDSTPATDQVQIANADLYVNTGLGVIHADGVTAGYILRADGTRYIPANPATTLPIAPMAQGDMLIADATPEWSILTTGAAAGYALVTDGTTQAWDQTPNWSGLHNFDAGLEIGDDQPLNFGDGADAIGQFVSANNRVEWTGVDWLFDDQIVNVGTVGGGNELLAIRNDTNAGFSGLELVNADGGASAYVAANLKNTAGAGLDHALTLATTGTGFTTAGLAIQDSGILQTGTNISALVLRTLGAAAPVVCGVNAADEVWRADSTGLVVNEDGRDVDFRVESDTLTHALFVQGSDGATGIRATPSGAAGLYVPWVSGDAVPTMFVGSSNTSNNQVALSITSYSSPCIFAQTQQNSHCITGETLSATATDAAVLGYANGAAIGGRFYSDTGIGLQANLTGAGTAIATFLDNGAPILTIQDGGNVLLTSPATLDLNGIADCLILDTDGDTTLSAPTDDQIDIEVGGSDVVHIDASGIGVNVVPSFLFEGVKDGSVAVLLMDHYGSNNVQVIGRTAAGSEASPSATPSGRLLLAFAGRGHDGTSWTATRAFFGSYAEENYTAGAQGTYMRFETTASGGTSRSEKARITGGGDLLLGTTTAPTANSGKVLTVGDNTADPTMGSNTAGFYGKDVGGTVEAFAVDEAGNAAQLTPHNFDGPVQPIPGTLHWSQYHQNSYLGVRKWYDIERALLALEALTGEQFIYTEPLPVRERRNWEADQHKRLKAALAQGERHVVKRRPFWMR